MCIILYTCGIPLCICCQKKIDKTCECQDPKVLSMYIGLFWWNYQYKIDKTRESEKKRWFFSPTVRGQRKKLSRESTGFVNILLTTFPPLWDTCWVLPGYYSVQQSCDTPTTDQIILSMIYKQCQCLYSD